MYQGTAGIFGGVVRAQENELLGGSKRIRPAHSVEDLI